MIPANHRSMARPASHSRICMAALYSTPGICRCPRCHIEPPATGAATDAPEAAAARQSGPFPSGGGTPTPLTGATTQTPVNPAAARLPSREYSPGGGLFGDQA
jgi:hypothetical protein